MKRLIIPMLAAIAAFSACSKQADQPTAQATHRSNARTTGAIGGHTISTAQANACIGSYLASVGYPSVDTAFRTITFDADSLRDYLSNPGIRQVKFHMAHNPTYAQDSTGINKGLNAISLTLVIIGEDVNNQPVTNRYNGFLDQGSICPPRCN